MFRISTILWFLVLAPALITRASIYNIAPTPQNSILGPNGPVSFPATVQQFIQSNPSAFVSAVNKAGQMVVNLLPNESTSSGIVYVYLPTAAYGLSAGMNLISETKLGAFSINNSGQVAGNNGNTWVIWNIGGSETPLGQGVTPGVNAMVWQINDSGQAIAQDLEPGGMGRVYVYSPTAQNGYSAGMNDLTPQGSGYIIPLAFGLNKYGDALYNVDGHRQGGIPSPPFQAYLRIGSSHNGLAGGSTYTLSGTGWSMYQAAGLNDLGQVVGMATFTNGTTSYNDPVLWSGNTVTDLSTLLPANSSWTLQTVTSIDQLGDIEGTGLYNGVSTPFILWAPEPCAAFSLLGFGPYFLIRPRRPQ